MSGKKKNKKTEDDSSRGYVASGDVESSININSTSTQCNTK